MSRVFNSKGRRETVRLSAKGKLRIVAGLGRVSLAMGAQDPRLYRNPQGATATERQFSAQHFTVDKTGHIRPKE